MKTEKFNCDQYLLGVNVIMNMLEEIITEAVKNYIYKSIIISHMPAICHLTFSKKKNKRNQRLKNVCIYSSLFSFLH